MDSGTIIVLSVFGLAALWVLLPYILSAVANKGEQWVKNAYHEYKNEKGVPSESLAELHKQEQHSDE